MLKYHYKQDQLNFIQCKAIDLWDIMDNPKQPIDTNCTGLQGVEMKDAIDKLIEAVEWEEGALLLICQLVFCHITVKSSIFIFIFHSHDSVPIKFTLNLCVPFFDCLTYFISLLFCSDQCFKLETKFGSGLSGKRILIYFL